MVGFTARTRDISLLRSVQNSSEAHPASYIMGTRRSFPRAVQLTTHLILLPRQIVLQWPDGWCSKSRVKTIHVFTV